MDGPITYTATALDQAQDLWIEVFGVRVCIGRNDEGVTVEVWPREGGEEPLAGVWVLYDEIGEEPS
jgi:hypothetical protein